MSYQQELFETLRKLTRIPGTSGFEQEIARKMHAEMKPLADEIEVDHVGNVYAHVTGASKDFRVMVPAHSDSVGLIISHIEQNGYLRFDPVGKVPPNLAYAQRVLITTERGEICGVVGSKPGHIAADRSPADGMTVPPIDSLFIDIGAASKEAAEEMGIVPGQQAVFDRELAWLGDGSTRIVTGRSLDDRVGCLVIIETLKRIAKQGKKPPVSIVFCAAVQEEVGLRGAIMAGQRLNPDLCIGVDATISQAGYGTGRAAMPSTSYSEAATIFDGGPCISVYDMSSSWGLFGHPRIVALLKSTADARGLRYQIEGSMQNITSDPAGVQFAGKGVPSATVKIPSRYTHGPVETVSLGDVEATIDLLYHALMQLKSDMDLSFVDL
jgi:endoglucanase